MTQGLKREDKTQEHYDDFFNNHPDAEELKNLEDKAITDYANTGTDQAEARANAKNPDVDPARNINNTSEREKAAPSENDNLYNPSANSKKPIKLTFKGALKRGGPIGIITGGIGIPIIIFMALLPLKLFGLVANMTEAASAVPGYAAERRVEYLMTRAFATWLVKKSSGANITDAELANKAIFCKGASIGCSLTMTRIGDYFDKKYDFNKLDGNKVEITPKGRDSLGQKARSWTIATETKLDDGLQGPVNRQVKTIESNKEMRTELKRIVNQQMGTKSMITRFIARKVLMKRFGVTMWRGFEKTSNKIADKKAAFKAGIMRNTIGKISPRMATYLECLSGGASCEKLKESYANKIDDSERKKDADGNYTESKEEYDRRLARNESLKKAAGISTDVPKGEQASKFLSRQLYSKVAGGAAIAGVLDLLFGAIGAVKDGALESVMYDIRSNTYVGYAFGDSTGIIPNIEKIKAGDGDDPDLMPILAEQLEGVEQSPVWQAENGMITGNEKGGWSRICDVDGKQEKVVLKGQYVCPERQLAQSVTDWMDSPSGKTLGTAADAWNNTVGKVFDFAGWAINGIMEKSGVNKVIEKAFGKAFKKAVQWMLGLFFDAPAVGDEAPGDQNYDALSAATWISQNSLMENGVDEDGDLLGGGGNLLSDKEITMIQTEQNKEDREYFDSQPQIAKIFDVNLRGSFMNAFLARIPMATFTSTLSIASLPSAALTSTASILTPHALAGGDATPTNPHNIPLYGYAPGDADLTAEPTDDRFSAESCKESAEARRKSYTLKRSKYPIPIYTKNDPCALEKMAVGSVLQEMGVTDDPNSFKDPTGDDSGLSEEESNSDSASFSGEVAWPLEKKWWNSNKSDWLGPHTAGTGTAWGEDNMGTSGKGTDIAADIGSPSDGSPVFAMVGGTVTSTNLCGENDGIAIKTMVDGKVLGISYMHGTDKKFEVGDTVEAGDQIMSLGAIGCHVDGAHVHIGIAYDGKYICPQDVFLALDNGESVDWASLTRKAAAPCGRP